ncbi:hypothetical protein [Methylogaea oryzae]|uniref:hypothetical protein n=1 Tax=Methylogaea oryzae TaxID=1295382 RepID=UPI0020D181C6|nr:hypothetical protein [Methylogaea oryzae]
MSDSLTQQTIALAGLAQSACLVQQIARRGQATTPPWRPAWPASSKSMRKMRPTYSAASAAYNWAYANC